MFSRPSSLHFQYTGYLGTEETTLFVKCALSKIFLEGGGHRYNLDMDLVPLMPCQNNVFWFVTQLVGSMT